MDDAPNRLAEGGVRGGRVAESTGPSTRRRARLRSNLVALVLLVTLPLAALSIVSALSERHDATTEAHQRTAGIASIGALVVNGIIIQTDGMLETVGRLSNPRGSRCSAELPAAQSDSSIHDNIYSVDDDGTVACTAVDDPLVTNVSNTAWFQSTEARRTITVTVPADSITTGAPTMLVSRPLPLPVEPDELPPEPIDQTRPGLLAASLDPQTMVDFVTAIELPKDSVVEVLDAEGQVVARNVDAADYFLQAIPQFDEIRGNATGTVDGEGVDGIYRLYSYERVEVGGDTLYMMAGVSRDEAYGHADTHLVRSLTILVVLGLGVGVLTLAATRSILVLPVERLRRATSGFRSGDVTRRAGEVGGPAEVVELGAAFDAMADEIQSRLQGQQHLLDQLEEAGEAERQSIAAGIHDEVLQNLSAVGIRIQLLRRGADERQVAELDRAREMLDASTAQLRGLLFDLRPPNFDRIGLAATLRETLEVRLGADLGDWSVTGEPGPEVPDQAQILIYRIAQQALANIREHAGAHRVDIRIATAGRLLTMDVTDDGAGFDVGRIESEARPGHIGLRVMRDRARAAGGELTITSVPGEGTTVRAEVPFERSGPPVAANPDETGVGGAGDPSEGAGSADGDGYVI